MSSNRDATFSIRRAAAADVSMLAVLGATTFVEAFGIHYPRADLDEFLATAYSEAACARLLADPAVAVWLAYTTAEVPVGFAVAGPCKLPIAGVKPGAGEIRQLYLRSAVQNRGLGTHLLKTVLAWLTAAGREPLYVGVWSKNPGAQRLYARFGFEKIGEYDFPVGRILDREFILRRR